MAGSKAPAPLKAAADAHSKACIDDVNGEVPWESYRVTGQAMLFDGEKTGLSKEGNFARWTHLTPTEERREMFTTGGRSLVFTAIKDSKPLTGPGKE